MESKREREKKKVGTYKYVHYVGIFEMKEKLIIMRIIRCGGKKEKDRERKFLTSEKRKVEEK